MCALTGIASWLIPTLIGAGSAAASFLSQPKATEIQMPDITSYTPESTIDVSAPEAPSATPTFGQKSAEDLQADASSDAVKKNKKGRSALRIDRNPGVGTPTTGGTVSSGTVVPQG